jgi:hypothetical protein
MVATMIAAAYFTAGTFAYAATVFAVNFALSQIVTRVFGQDQQGPQDSGTRQQVPPSSVNAIPVVYGDAYLGGTFVDAVLTTDQKTMYYVLAVSCISPNGQFSFDTTKMYYGDRLVVFDSTDTTKVIKLIDEAENEDTKISGNLYINLYVSDAVGNITSPNGAAAPTTVMGGSDIDAVLRWVSTGPAPRKMNGLAFAIVKLNYNQDAGTTNLSPITFYAKHYLNSTGAAKPGDVWYDYITNKQYGGAVGWLPDGTFSPDFVNVNAVTDLNAYSDQTITYEPSGGGSATQARYRMNGVLDAGQTVLSNLDKIMTCCDSWMAYNAALGQWSIVINKSETTAYAFDDDNIIGEVRVSATDITQSINQVEAKFPDKGARDQPNFVNIATPSILRYPNEPDNKYSVSYDLCNDSVQAQYLANRILEQAREDLIVSFSTTYYGIQVDAGAVVSVTNADYGWTNKLFRVVKVNEASLPDGSLGAKLELSEYSAAVYDDFDITQYTPVPNSEIPSAIYFSALSTPTVLSSSPATTPATFVVRTVVPVTGRVTFGTLYYTTSTSPAAYDWKVLQTASTPLGTSATNGANYDFVNLQLSAGTYYFTYVVGNELGSSARSPTSTAFAWSPVNSESGNVAALQAEIIDLGIDVADKVSKTTSNILTGTIVPQDSGGIKAGSITWNTSGVVTGGSGVAITENGIVGAKAGVPNFTIDTAGNATFKGDINTAGDAFFAGNNPTTVQVNVGGTTYFVDYSSAAYAQTSVAGVARTGQFGYATSSGSGVNVGVLGFASVLSNSYGVVGLSQGSNGVGGFFSSSTAGGKGIEVTNTGGGVSLAVNGRMTISVTTLVSNLNAEYWNGFTSSDYARIFPTNSGTANAAGSGLNLFGSTSTGIAGAYVGTSGSGNVVTFTVQTTSPSDVRLKEEIADSDLGLSFVNQLRPVSYKLKADPKHQKGYGFIADEVEDLIGLESSLVYHEPDWKVGDEVGFKTIHYPSYIAVLTKAIQELSAKVDEQQKLIESLQNKG